MRPALQVLFEDSHCLAVWKPPGRVATHFQGGEETLDREVKRYLKQKYHKPGNVYLGVVHRLDRPVSGVLLFARTSKAAARLAKQFREGSVSKTYWGIIEGRPEHSAGTLRNYLARDAKPGTVRVARPEETAAREAVLDYRVRAHYGEMTWLELSPRTGRKHQIRVQLAAIGHPVFGDQRYGSRHRLPHAIALHARELRVHHPVRDELLQIIAEVPAFWSNRFPAFFGTAHE